MKVSWIKSDKDSKNFKIPKTSIKIIKGETSKDKTVLFETQDELKLKLLNNTFS